MAQNHARDVGGIVVETFQTDEDISTLFPSGYFKPCGPDVVQGWTFSDGVYAAPVVSPAAAAPRYVPLATIRERVTAAGHWEAFAGAVDALPAAKRWHLQTLAEGVASDDPDATALLTAIGCDPAAVLAP